MAVVKSLGKKGLVEGDDQHCTITEAGRAFIEQARETAQDLYPWITGPVPCPNAE